MAETQAVTSDFNGMDFDGLEPKEEKVRHRGIIYILREASEKAAVEWKNSHLRSARVVDGKISSFGNMADGEPLLVSLCLYKADKNGQLPLDRNNNPDNASRVSVQTLLEWPSKVVARLFKRAKEMSDLEEQETQQVLEQRYQDTCKKLAALAENEEDKQKWKDWAVNTFCDHLAESDGPRDEPAKNGQSSTPVTSS